MLCRQAWRKAFHAAASYKLLVMYFEVPATFLLDLILRLKSELCLLEIITDAVPRYLAEHFINFHKLVGTGTVTVYLVRKLP